MKAARIVEYVCVCVCVSRCVPRQDPEDTNGEQSDPRLHYTVESLQSRAYINERMFPRTSALQVTNSCRYVQVLKYETKCACRRKCRRYY